MTKSRTISQIIQPQYVIEGAGVLLQRSIAPYGPFVMNTMEEIQQTLVELRNGTFIK
jgi:redox-sensitive bicupin YhaK (pirin superfamily)